MINDRADIQKIIDKTSADLKQIITDLEEIISLISNQERIDSFENRFCKNCNEPCGRSNAEILNCVIEKQKLTKKRNQEDKNKTYMKEYLEKDLNKMLKDLKLRYEDIQTIASR